MDAWDIGRGRVLRRVGGEVINGGRGGWLGLDDGEDTAGGDVAGEEFVDIMAIIMTARPVICMRRRRMASRL